MYTASFSYLKHEAEGIYTPIFPTFEELLYQFNISVKPPQFVQQGSQKRARGKNQSPNQSPNPEIGEKFALSKGAHPNPRSSCQTILTTSTRSLHHKSTIITSTVPRLYQEGRETGQYFVQTEAKGHSNSS